MRKWDYWPLIFAVVFTLICAYGNIFLVQKGGILDNAILKKDDPYRQMDKYVKSVFAGQEGVMFILRFPGRIKNEKDLKSIEEFHQEISDAFPNRGIHSLANVSNYRDINNTLYSDKYTDTISIVFRRNNRFNFDIWKNQVKSDPGVLGILINQDFTHAAFILYLEKGYDEIEVFREVVQFSEKREISELEWFIKSEITPKNPNLLISGWVVGRGLIDGALNADILKMLTLGIFFSVLLFYFSTGSLSQSMISAFFVILLSIFWTRGEIGIFNFLGFEIRERVYVILAYTNCIVQGISFSLHMFSSYNPFSGKIFTKPLFLEGMRNSWEICSRRNNSIAKYVELCSTLKQRT